LLQEGSNDEDEEFTLNSFPRDQGDLLQDTEDESVDEPNLGLLCQFSGTASLNDSTPIVSKKVSDGVKGYESNNNVVNNSLLLKLLL